MGVEIMESAVAVQRFPFSGNVAFMVGNEGQVRISAAVPINITFLLVYTNLDIRSQ